MGWNYDEGDFCTVYLFIQNKRIISFLLCRREESEKNQMGVVVMGLWVALNHRRQGVGTNLMKIMMQKEYYSYSIPKECILFQNQTEIGRAFWNNFCRTLSCYE